MNTTKSLKVISLILILTMLGNMILLPGAAQARPQALPSAVASVVNGGERFMTAAPEALGQALELAQLLDYIEQTRLENLTEPILVQARERALATAQQAATAQGSVGAIANGLTELDYEVQAAANVAAEVANLDTAGFGADLETALQDAGLTPAQITSLETAAVHNFTVRGSDLPTATVTALQDAGLTSTEIDQVEQALADYGLADDTLPDRLAQFQTSQQELSIVRTQALVAYLQLLTKQVFVRQAAGETGRDMSAAEVEDLVKDQLRLLIHLGYLDSLGGGSNPNVGEGQWLFIERYSLRVAERLDELILETHNVGLVVDLLVALQIHGMALAALAGDAAYAKTEVEPLADFLETLLGDNLPGGQAARETEPPFWWTTTLALRASNPALLSGYEPALEPAAVAVAQSQAQGRIKGLASPLWLPLAQGTVTESDETNNTTQTLFHTTAPVLPPGVLDILNQVLGGATPLEFLWEVLTGQTENGWAIGGNIILSFVPVAGEILDLIALFSEPTLWGKAMALIGLVASILSDGTEILAAVGIAVPPALVALPAAIGAEAVDVGAAILRNVDNLVSGATYELIKRIPFAEALQLGGEILSHLARRAVEAVEGASNWPGSLEGVVDLIQSVLEGVWGPFVALLTHYGDDLGKLFRLGFGEGGFLAGRVLKHGGEYSDDAIETIAKIGTDLGPTAAELSDEATGGLGKLARALPEDYTQRLINTLCPGGVTSIDNYRVRGLASPLLQTACNINFQKILENVFQWDEIALDGFKKLRTGGVDDTTLSNFLTKYADDAITSNRILSVVGSSNQTWSKLSFEGLIKITDDVGIEAVETVVQSYSDEVIEQTFRTIRTTSAQWSSTGLEGVAKMIDRLDQPLVEAILNRQGRGEFGNQVFTWLNKIGDSPAAQGNNFREWAQALSVNGNTYVGAVFELRYAADELVDDGIKIISDKKNGKLAIDFIMQDERHVELKNWSNYGSGNVNSAVEQFKKNLLELDADSNPVIDPDTGKGLPGRYGDQKYEYIFRGPYNANIVQKLLDVADEARRLGILRRPFSVNNIKFLGETIPFP